MFHLLQVDIKISSWECSLVLPRTFKGLLVVSNFNERIGRVPCTIRVVTCFIFLDLVLLYLTDLFIGFNFFFWDAIVRQRLNALSFCILVYLVNIDN